MPSNFMSFPYLFRHLHPLWFGITYVLEDCLKMYLHFCPWSFIFGDFLREERGVDIFVLYHHESEPLSCNFKSQLYLLGQLEYRRLEQGSQKGEVNQDSRRGIFLNRVNGLCSMEGHSRSRASVSFGARLN